MKNKGIENQNPENNQMLRQMNIKYDEGNRKNNK